MSKPSTPRQESVLSGEVLEVEHPIDSSSSLSTSAISPSSSGDTDEPQHRNTDILISASAPTYEGRVRWLEKVLLGDGDDDIPRETVTSFIFKYGVPDRPHLRSICWKLLLGYLPWRRSDWEASLREQRRNYNVFIKELMVNPFEDCDDPLSATDPLGLTADKSKESKWAEYYKDEEIRNEIDKDVKRTYSTLHFFQLPVHPDDHVELQRRQRAEEERERAERQKAMKKDQGLFNDDFSSEFAHNLSEKTVTAVQVVVATEKAPDCHHDVLRRLLFLFAKLNPGVRYVQGMNEILAPIYYVFATDSDPYSTRLGLPFGAKPSGPDDYIFGDAEADAFGCFMAVMAELRDRYIKSLDHSESGVLAVVKRMHDLLKDVDEELWEHLERNGVDPRFYSFRWLTLLMSQEFELPDVLRLWDSFFADKERFEYQLYFSCAMLVHLRKELLTYDFADILRVLQSYPYTDIQVLLTIATDLRVSHQRGCHLQQDAGEPQKLIQQLLEKRQ